jgi:hypothetical protein
VQLVARFEALVSTNLLQDNSWSVVLLVGRPLSLAFGVVGFAVMVACLIAGPDGMAPHRPSQPPVSATSGNVVPTS